MLTAEFPYDAVAGLGETWKWSATTNVQGDDVDITGAIKWGDAILAPVQVRRLRGHTL
jgi:hypothetical protein